MRAILEALAEAGVLGLARREGNRRVYDLAERLFPAGLLAERRTEEEQRRHKLAVPIPGPRAARRVRWPGRDLARDRGHGEGAAIGDETS